MRYEYLMLRHGLAIIEKDRHQISKVLGSPDPMTGKKVADTETLGFAFQVEQKFKTNR